MVKKEILSQTVFEKMKILNNKLQNLQLQIFKTASEYDQFFKQKVDNPNDSLKDYEIVTTIYLTREEDDV